MEAKKAKLRQQFKESATKESASEQNTGIFHGIAIFINGYTVPSADELKRIMMVHGGMFHHYMSDRTTHIIATNLPDVKIKKLKIMRVVKPEWIVESVQAGKLLDFRSYLLYSHQSTTQPRLQFGIPSSTSLEPGVLQCNDIGQGTLQPSLEPSCEQNPCEINITCQDVSPTQPLSPDILSSNSNCESEISDLSCTPLPNMATCNKFDEVLSDSHNTEVVGKSLTSKPSLWAVRSAGEAGFLSEFYNNSRLHHISTMGATFKQYVNQLREKSDKTYVSRERLKDWVASKKQRDVDLHDIDDIEDISTSISDKDSKVFMHIDMDCFFVSVGLRSRPELRGLPVAVTHAKAGNANVKPRSGVDRKAEFSGYKQRLQDKRSKSLKGHDIHIPTRVDDIDETSSMAEIASCSYEARKAGLKNGMFVGQALKLCPNLRTMPYDFEGYKEVSYKLYDTVSRYTLDIEAVSCDELFVDCTTLLNETGASPLEFATYIRREIKDQTGCPASTGFGSNLLQARMATKQAKPNGQFHLKPSNVTDFMRDIKLSNLPGVGRSLSYKLQDLSVTTCGELQQLSLAKLQKEFGLKTGESLYRHCRGDDDRKLTLDHVRKSVSAEVNYGIRFTNQDEADNFFRELAGEVTNRLKEINMKGRCITLKLMVRAKEAPKETAKFMGHGLCDNITKSVSWPRAIADAHIIAREVLSIARQFKIPPSELRGVGIQVSRLESETKSGGLQNFFVKKSMEAKIFNCLEKPKQLMNDPINDIIVAKPKLDVICDSIPTSSGMVNFLVTKTVEGEESKLKTSKTCQKDCPDLRIKSQGSTSALDISDGGSETIGNELDPEVLAALPEDIRQEVLLDYHRKKKETNRRQRDQQPGSSDAQNDSPGPSKQQKQLPGTSQQIMNQQFGGQMDCYQIESSFLAALPEDLRNELEAELQQRNLKSHAGTDNVVVAETKANYQDVQSQDLKHDDIQEIIPHTTKPIGMQIVLPITEPLVESSYLTTVSTLSEMRTLIKEWVRTESLPQPCDVTMLAKHFQQLAAKREIEVLDLLVKCLYRCISMKRCSKWQEAFHNIINKAQDTMEIVYGNRLKVPLNFDLN